MRDVSLWHMLRAGHPAAALAPRLETLAAQSFRVRAPFFPLVAPLARHPSPAVRAAVIAVLAGARGVKGLRALVDALDDDATEVRAAAVRALRAAAGDAPTRFAHAVFHRRADVRRAALVAGLPHAIGHYGAYLRADPETRDLARAMPWPQPALPLAVDLYQREALAPGELLALLAGQAIAEIRAFLEATPGRARDETEAYLREAATAAAPPTATGRDVLDLFCDAAGRAPEAAPPALAALGDAATGRSAGPLRRRLLVAFLASLGGRGFGPHAVALCAGLEPRVLAFPFFAREMAPAAAEGLRRYRLRRPIPAGEARRLLGLPIMLAGGLPDLTLAAAVAGRAGPPRLGLLAGCFGDSAVIDAILADPRGWEAICALPSEPLELEWLVAARARDPRRSFDLAALALARWSDQEARHRRLLAALAAADRAQVVAALIDTSDRGHPAATWERIAELAPAIARELADPELTASLAAALIPAAGGAPTPTASRLALELARVLSPDRMQAVVGALPPRALGAFLDAAETLVILPWDHEVALARALLAGPDARGRDFARRVLRAAEAVPSALRPPALAVHPLTAAERTAIETCPLSALEAALAPALAAPTAGLAAALAARPAPPGSHLAACVALIACPDPLPDVARELERFAGGGDSFVAALEAAAVTMWNQSSSLPPLGHAVLYRWERHDFGLASWIEGEAGGVLGALHAADALAQPLARRLLWRGVAEVFVLYRFRFRDRFEAAAAPELAEHLIAALDGPTGHHAARMLVTWLESDWLREIHADLRRQILERAADTGADTRELLARVVRLDGLPAASRAAEPLVTARDLLHRIQASSDLDELVDCLRDPNPVLSREAMRRLLEVEGGKTRVRSLAGDPSLSAALRFRIGLALAEDGELSFLEFAIAAACEPAADPWFRREDWDRMIRVGDPRRLACALAGSYHHHAYQRALELLLAATDRGADLRDALAVFVEVGCARPLHLRRAAARKLLAEFADDTGLPILLEETAVADVDAGWLLPSAEPDLRPELLAHLVDMALFGGEPACSEARACELTRLSKAGPGPIEDAHAELLEHGMSAAVRRRVARALSTGAEAPRQARVARVCEVFAWGVRRARELTGRLFRVHMSGVEGELGHTFLSQDRVFVSPLPLLRGERGGRDVVEGLILHEIGHHLYHGGEEAAAIWKRASDDGLGHLLNLVADEHLERNLRAVDAGYGDRLKRLGAYAFQHAAQEIALDDLLAALRGAAAATLTAMKLEVAFADPCVRIRRGEVLGFLDRTGHPLARFVRALRLGLGDRHEDPLVTEALGLFDRGFRHLDMAGLDRLTRRLAAMFGGEVALASVFGGPEGITWSERDGDVHGAGIDDDMIQREVERILDPRRGRGGSAGAGAGPPGRLSINVSPELAFEPITHVVRVRGGQERHRELATSVRRHADRLRELLRGLGRRWLPVGARLSGRTLDRSRLRSLVTRGDPRILRARHLRRDDDLFLGVAIDCSGSMAAGGSLERAQRFAVLIAEAVRPLAGVEARFFGFTDSTLFDAGDARDCAVTALEAGGGNNDAAALAHLAAVALRSPRRARVLVMVSDGLPTECSADALRALVSELGRRRRLFCAQVAVRPLEEVCFPHYLVLDGPDVDVAAARFGRMVGELARRALAQR